MSDYYKENPENVTEHPYVLKAVHFSERFSEDSNCFDAKLYRGKTLIATVRDSGHGGNTDVRFVSKEAAAEVNEYLAGLPVRGWYNFNDERGEFPDTWDAEALANDLFSQWFDADQKKKYAATIKRQAKTKLLGVSGDQDPELEYFMYKGYTYGQLVRYNGGSCAVQDVFREKLEAKGETNVRFFDPAREEWV